MDNLIEEGTCIFVIWWTRYIYYFINNGQAQKSYEPGCKILVLIAIFIEFWVYKMFWKLQLYWILKHNLFLKNCEITWFFSSFIVSMSLNIFFLFFCDCLQYHDVYKCLLLLFINWNELFIMRLEQCHTRRCISLSSWELAVYRERTHKRT